MNNKILPLIKFKQYKLFLTSQPYFIWHNSLEKVNKPQKPHNVEEIKNDFSNELYNDEDFLEKQLWDNLVFDFSINDEDEWSYIEANANIFAILKQKIIAKIEEKYPSEKIYFVSSKKIESAIIETENAIASGKYQVIFHPAFQFQNAVATPSVYFVDEAKVSNFIFSTSTKAQVYSRAFWDYWITKKSNHFLNVSEYSLFMIDILDNYRKNDFPIVETKSAWIGKSKKNITALKKRNKIITANVKKCLNFYGNYSIDDDSCDPELYNITNFLEKHFLPSNSKNDEDYEFASIENAIFQINQAYDIEKPEDLNRQLDDTKMGRNPYFKEILALSYPEIAGISGAILRVSKIFDYIETKKEKYCSNLEILLPETLAVLSKTVKNMKSITAILEKKDSIDHVELEAYKAILEAPDKVVVWYDFEGFSLPYPTMDGVQPYEQIIFQVSIIRTKNNQIISKENIVYDPQKIGIHAFKEIIDKVYSHKAWKFVVYNKGYENSKLSRMVEHIVAQEKGFLSLVTPIDIANKYYKRVQHIIENTIDLNDLFKKYSTKSGVPAVFLSSLRGFSSIKKIENYITNSDYNLKFKIKPYKKLEIQNGLMAMNAAINRYLGEIGDHEWNNQKVPQLKEYCENDVMAMLMVYDFIKTLLKVF